MAIKIDNVRVLGWLDARYLRLDCVNDPLTDTLTIGTTNATGLIFNSLGTATIGIDMTSAGLSGTDNLLSLSANDVWRADGALFINEILHTNYGNVNMRVSVGDGGIRTSRDPFYIQYGQPYDTRFYDGSATGENAQVRFYGYPTGGSLDFASFQIIGANDDLQIVTNKANSDIILSPNAYVGIGTTNPATKLDVNGSITIADDQWIGLASNQARLTFDASPITTTVTFDDADVFMDNDLTVAGTGTFDTIDADHALNLDANLVAWWRMDDISGSTVSDFTDNGNNGTLVNQAAQADGIIGKAVTFDGTGDYINIDDGAAASLDFGSSTDFSVSFWMKTTKEIQHIITHRSSGNHTKRWRILTGGTGVIWINLNDGTNNVANTTSPVLNDGLWKHIVVTFDRDGNGTTYVNDVSQTPFSISTIGDLSDLDTFDIGGDSLDPQYEFSGLIDDVRIYSRILTSNEVTELYELGTLDKMTSLSKAYFTEYVASRSGFFNYANVITDLFIGGDVDVVGDLTAGTIQADNGFTGTGAYTLFTIVGGVITAAS